MTSPPPMQTLRRLCSLSLLAVAWLVLQGSGLVLVGRDARSVSDLHRQQAQLPPLPVVGQGRAAISGLVRDAVTGRPVAGAIVSLSPQAGNRVGPGVTQVTDETGEFVFTDLGPGDGYLVGASRFGYFRGGFGRTTATSSTRRIALTEGEWFPTATIDLWREAAVNGAVFDEAGEPVVGAHVRVLAEIMVAGASRVVGGLQARTDDRGRYRIAGLSPGRYFVTVPAVQMSVPASASNLTLSGLRPSEVSAAEASGTTVAWRRDPAVPLDSLNRLILGLHPTPPAPTAGPARAYPIVYAPAAHTRSEAQPITLGFGDDRQGVDVHLTPVDVRRIHGRVEGPAASIADLTLRLLAKGDEDFGVGSEVATSLVAADATFTFLNVPTGRYTILASRTISEYALGQAGSITTSEMPVPPGRVTSGMTGSAVTAGPPGTWFSTRIFGSGDLSGRQEVEVGASDVRDVVVRLERGATLRGRVVIERSTLGTGSSTQPPRVRAEPAGGEAALAQPSGTRDPNDPLQFVIAGLGRGEYLLRILGGVIKSVTWNGGDYTYRPFDASSGADIDDVVITTTDRAARVTGVVRDDRGRVAASAAVIAFPVEPAQWRRYGLQPARLRSVQASNTGTFDISRLPAGDYYVIAVAEDQGHRWTDPSFLEVASRVAVRVAVDWGGSVAQNLSITSVK